MIALRPMSFLRITTPTNIAEEHDRFFRDQDYEPQFIYDWDQQKIDRYLQGKKHYRPLVEAVLSQNSIAITKQAQILFHVDFSADAENAARAIVSQQQPFTPTTKEHVVKALESAIDYLDLPYTLKEVEDVGFRFRPLHAKKELLMSTSLNLDWMSADSLAKHEITHVIRAVNTAYNHIPESSDYLFTEEGLASLMADDYAHDGYGSRHQHAIEYLAAQKSLSGSFRDVYQIFCDYGFSKEGAWQRAIRHKFGFCDTSQPGGIMKPAMYFLSRLALLQLSRPELLRLFVGKIATHQLSAFPAYRGVVPEEKILSYFHLT